LVTGVQRVLFRSPRPASPPKTPTLRYITTPKDAQSWKPEDATVVN
jgi:hypothetical protein